MTDPKINPQREAWQQALAAARAQRRRQRGKRRRDPYAGRYLGIRIMPPPEDPQRRSST